MSEELGVFGDPSIPDDIKAQLILCFIKCKQATDIYKLRDAFALLIKVIDDCIAAAKANNPE